MQRFFRDISGVTAIIFSIMLIPLLLGIGVSLDFGRSLSVKTQLQSALDAAVLAGAVHIVDPDRAVADAASFFDANNDISGVKGVSFVVEDGVLRGTATVSVPTTLMSIAKIESVDFHANSAATNEGAGIELVLVLDVSGSMSKEILTLRQAATNLLEVIYGDSSTLPNTWVGLVPFSGRVNIIEYGTDWVGDPPSMSNGMTDPVGTKCKLKDEPLSSFPGYPRLCTNLRTGLNQENDALPSSELFSEFGLVDSGQDPVVCPVPKAVGLTASRATIQSAVDQLCAGHGTSTHIGMVWGWRMISQKWKGLWGDPNLPLSNNETPGKYVIIMTDGKNHPNQSGDPYSEAEVDAQLLRECDAMKSEGITILAVTFKMDGALTGLYQNCASKPEYEFDAENSEALEAVFTTIGRIVTTGQLRLIQ